MRLLILALALSACSASHELDAGDAELELDAGVECRRPSAAHAYVCAVDERGCCLPGPYCSSGGRVHTCP